MIRSFADKETEMIFQQRQSRRFPLPVQRIALRKLIMMDAADTVNDLRVPPGNRLEKLSGDRAGQWSIRVNDQYRICFCEQDGGLTDVTLVDYH